MHVFLTLWHRLKERETVGAERRTPPVHALLLSPKQRSKRRSLLCVLFDKKRAYIRGKGIWFSAVSRSSNWRPTQECMHLHRNAASLQNALVILEHLASCEHSTWTEKWFAIRCFERNFFLEHPAYLYPADSTQLSPIFQFALPGVYLPNDYTRLYNSTILFEMSITLIRHTV